MGEIEGTYRVLQTAGTRLGAQTPVGVSTLELGQTLPPRVQEKHVRLRVRLLDGTVEGFDVEPKCDGQVLLAQVWKHLNLIECDYFGLEFQNIQSYWIWLEPMKPIIRQIRRPKNAILRLAVKFFPPDPGQLQEEYTRYLFALQLKRDLLEERLTCAATTAALLTSHLLQGLYLGQQVMSLDQHHREATLSCFCTPEYGVNLTIKEWGNSVGMYSKDWTQALALAREALILLSQLLGPMACTLDELKVNFCSLEFLVAIVARPKAEIVLLSCLTSMRLSILTMWNPAWWYTLSPSTQEAE